MQIERRQNPYPFTWEIPAGVVVIGALLLVLGVHVGRGLANLIAGAGWHWPQPAALFSALPGVLGGNATAGLIGPIKGAAAGPLLGWVVAVEAVVLVAGAVVAVVCLRRWGPGRLKGMATEAEAEAALGLSRLRRVRHIIRPDLHQTRVSPQLPSNPHFEGHRHG